jgi:hypothetical protein
MPFESVMPKGEFRISTNGLRAGNAVIVGVAQQRDAISAFSLSANALHCRTHENLAQAEADFLLVGALVSATSTSPFGITYNQRGWSRPPATALTMSPVAGFGGAPPGHPFASAMLMVGTRVGRGFATVGFVP